VDIKPPFVSVIIPVYNDADRLTRCLASLAEQTYPRDRFEVLVVDNGSKDDVNGVVQTFEDVRMLTELRAGSYAARNRGVREARGEIVAFTDADCVPSSTWIERGVAHLVEDPGIGLLGGRIDILAADPENPTGVELFNMMTSFQQRRFIEEFHFAATACAFTRISVLDRVGPFNEELLSGGDREWGTRVHASGLRLSYADDVAIGHPARRSLHELYARSKRLHAGARDASSGRRFAGVTGKKLVRLLVPPLGTAWRMFGDDRVPTFRSWVRLVGVLTLVRLMSVWFTLRFALGGRSPRQ
jgi:glycosyltransferase involved in cell wall biosynthesis